ncbi:MAG: alpha/beta hydrolase [Phycisphaerales bacterium]|nr:alpha/beta hydrolase [Phycisphaerales bacterium]
MTRPPMTWKRRLLRLLAILAAAYAFWCTLVAWRLHAAMFPRDFAGRPEAPVLHAGWTRLTHTPADDPRASVEAWLHQPADAAHASRCVVFFHGNAELIDHQLDLADEYAQRGCAVLLIEYRGYGRTTGSPTQAAIVADAIAIIDALPNAIDRAGLIYHGRSIGGAVAAQVATERRPAALILESTLTSTLAFTRRMGVPDFLIASPWRTDRALPAIDVPVLLLHGRHDTIIPPDHSRTLAALAPRTTLVELDGGHNDFPHDRVAYWDAIDAHLRTIP